jgi:hypothetical protein
VDLEVALQPAQRRQPGRLDRLDRGQMRLLVGQLAQQRVARRVAEAGVLGVDPDVRPQHRVVPD